jgi:hypothetical protein
MQAARVAIFTAARRRGGCLAAHYEITLLGGAAAAWPLTTKSRCSAARRHGRSRHARSSR